MLRTGRLLPPAEPRWDSPGVLRAGRFDDIYFSRDGGCDEKRHVFLTGCGLPAGWSAVPARAFTVGELGFGTGLNFLVTWDAWRRQRPAGRRLHYVAVEGFPLTPAELRDALASWEELRALSTALLRAYPQPQPGYHRIALTAGEDDTPVWLTLLFGDAAPMLHSLQTHIDAWYLDGFAPDRNPEMWAEDVIAHVARLSHAGAAPTRLATYSVAGVVRRRLQDAGFIVSQAPGFGTKRACLRAVFAGGPRDALAQPWFAPPPALDRGHAAVIGAGVAGTSIAYALRRRGWQVSLIDQHGRIAAGASGNPAGVIMPRLSRGATADEAFHPLAWRFLLQTLDDLGHSGNLRGRAQCGVLEIGEDAAAERRLHEIAARGVLPEPLLRGVTAAEAREIADCRVTTGGLFYPQAGWLDPQAFCAALAGDAALIAGEVVGIHTDHEGAELQFADGRTLACDVVVAANACGASRFAQTAWLPLSGRRGQVSLVSASPVSQGLRAVISCGSYVTPPFLGHHLVGATFDAMPASSGMIEVRTDDHQRNLAAAARLSADLTFPADAAVSGRAAIRCMTPDHLPLVGPMPDYGRFLEDYASLRHGQHWVTCPPVAYVPRVFTLTGLGARGLVTAPLAAELLASQICGEPWPVPQEVAFALLPARVLVRALKRGQL